MSLWNTSLISKLKEFVTIGGGEYMSSEFEQYLRVNGIRRQLSVAGCSPQNGVAERRNHSLADIARCLLIKSGLLVKLWAEAMSCATTLCNRRPTKANKGP